MEKSVPFYRDRLGLMLKQQFPGFAMFDTGAVTLVLSEDRAKSSPNIAGATEVIFSVEDVRTGAEALEAFSHSAASARRPAKRSPRSRPRDPRRRACCGEAVGPGATRRWPLPRPPRSVARRSRSPSAPQDLRRRPPGSRALASPAPRSRRRPSRRRRNGAVVLDLDLGRIDDLLEVAPQRGDLVEDAAHRVLDRSALSEASRARARMSLETTAKPRPASPARAASTAPLTASMLVWTATSAIASTIFSICGRPLPAGRSSPGWRACLDGGRRRRRPAARPRCGFARGRRSSWRSRSWPASRCCCASCALFSIWASAAEVCCVAAACSCVPRLIWSTAAMIWPRRSTAPGRWPTAPPPWRRSARPTRRRPCRCAQILGQCAPAPAARRLALLERLACC